MADYIFGNNTTKSSVAMTAPVALKPSDDAQSIAMTAPVQLSSSKEGLWQMAFSIPAEYTLETLPMPLNPEVKIIEVPEKHVAVVRYSGLFSNLEKRREMETKLIAWLATKPELKIVSGPIFLGYDPPFTLPFLRRNEVQFQLENTK